MAIQGMRITTITAMRARDVSRTSPEQEAAADSRPLRDESGRQHESRGKASGPRKSEPEDLPS
ncbi:hypothetical protein [Rhizohabitans arisaemae]|uniref:hypothetical protein n=1 Tax=Rhizohabitans arisaemae TaxID=2720610 RepID=UPI0024B049F8|nr:hypothetical protein [Rhizohabitans arisaemae]